jgi:palmitoyltransferase
LNHTSSIWAVFIGLSILFIPFVAGLLIYHSYLIAAGTTTWEHSRRNSISYLKIYPTGILPFYISILDNIKGNIFLFNL